jgi:hypothetical protein
VAIVFLSIYRLFLSFYHHDFHLKSFLLLLHLLQLSFKKPISEKSSQRHTKSLIQHDLLDEFGLQL